MLLARSVRTSVLARANAQSLHASATRSFRTMGGALQAAGAQAPESAKGTVPPVVTPIPAPETTYAAGGAVPPPPPPPKKKHRLRKLFVTTTALVALVYGAGVYLSLDNDEIFDVFTRYAPAGSIAVAVVDDLRFRQTIKHTASTGPAPKKNDTITVDGPSSKASAGLTKDYQTSPPKPRSPPVPKAAAAPAPAATPKAPAARPVTPIKKESSGDARSLPFIALKNIDPSLQGVVEATNSWIKSVNLAGGSPATSASVKEVADALQSASHEISAARERANAEVIADVERAASLRVASAQDQFDEDRKQLLKSYNDRLQKAVAAVRSAVVADANNLLSAQYIEQQDKFTRDIQNRVELEREGRLSKIQELTNDVTSLQRSLAAENESILDSSGVVDFFTTLGALQSELTTCDAAPRPLKSQFNQLKKAFPNDPLVAAAIDSVSDDVKKYGVLSASQLAARFQLLAPEIRKASLAPSDAGVAGHLSSLVASQLLIKKSGMPAGDDIESILARAETLLSQGRVVDAVAEVNALQGWPRKIAQDWLSEGRKRGELEFVVNVLSEEGILHGLSRA